MQSSNAGKRRRRLQKGEKFSERQILVIQLMGGGGLRALCFFKDGTESQVVQLGRERVLRRRRKKRERRRDKRQQEVDGKVIAVSTWSEARAVVLGGEANERRGGSRRV